MSDIYQQNFVPCSRGIIASAPSSLIPDGSVQDANNVRFDDGYMEKVKAFVEYKEVEEDQPIIAINMYRIDSSNILNMIHTPNGLYDVTDRWEEFRNLLEGEDYSVPIDGHISSVVAFNLYFFCSPDTPIYYWDGGLPKAKALEGTYLPDIWQPATAYELGDIVRPTTGNYSGYIYKCVTAGTSGDTIPEWEKDLSTHVIDGSCHWIGCGSLEVEGTSANSVKASCIEQYKDFIFIGNLDEDGESYPSRLRWSQWLNPRLWHNNEDGSGMAGYVDVNDVDGEIVALHRIGDILAVYKGGGIVAVTYSGGDTVFSKELVTTRAGLVSPTGLVVLPHSHIFVGKDNIYEFDGNTVNPIGDSIRNIFINTIKEKWKIVGFYNEETKDVIFAYKDKDYTGDNLNRAFIYNTLLRTWSLRDFGMTAIGLFSKSNGIIIDEVEEEYDSLEMQRTPIETKVRDSDDVVIVAGDSSGKLYKLEGYSDSRGDYDGYVITKTHHMDAPDRIKRLLRIQFHVETQGDYDMYVKVRPSWSPETPKEQIDWEELPSYTLNFRNSNTQKQVQPPFIDLDLSARYFQLKFGTTHNNEYFKVLGYTLRYQLRGDE